MNNPLPLSEIVRLANEHGLRQDELTQLHRDLKAKGASERLLELVWAAGPTAANLRTARALLGDPWRIKRLNEMSQEWTA